jgi:hypothetical protein
MLITLVKMLKKLDLKASSVYLKFTGYFHPRPRGSRGLKAFLRFHKAKTLKA